MTCTNPDWLGNVWEKKKKKKGIQAINEQPCLLKQDHEQGKRRAIYLKRADDFGVHISQIKNWHKRYRKHRRTSWGNGFVANVPYLWSVSERNINNISKQNGFIYIHMYAVIIKQNDQTYDRNVVQRNPGKISIPHTLLFLHFYKLWMTSWKPLLISDERLLLKDVF